MSFNELIAKRFLIYCNVRESRGYYLSGEEKSIKKFLNESFENSKFLTFDFLGDLLFVNCAPIHTYILLNNEIAFSDETFENYLKSIRKGL